MPSSGSCGASTRGVIFNFGYLGTNKKQSADPDPSCHKYPIPDDTPLPFGHRKIMPGQGNGPSDHTEPVAGIEAPCWRCLELRDPADGGFTSLRNRLPALTQGA